ncbi:sodium:solute symporter [Taibaiella chishuiensis]|uniref:SSS family transporter n=1 Tax=Taibaiella chishuiensis TaxID=1434707 RepID=A0A2P8D0M5_9BACT|nr:sodium:solute symporter [Taibaiella chishuiensis]PSK90768.1 SSS family transporter [Taibaiella chishuiensis]
MSTLDWIIMLVTLVLIIVYGIWQGRGQSGADTYLRAGQQMPWHVVLLGIMATQASAITFLSGPGQAYTDGMRFIQYYFGLPLAMIVISAVFVPIFQKLNVFTAYEYLDKRFDRKTRLFTGILFLFSRGVSTGISVYAPAIILSTIFGWNIYLTNILIGGLLIIYTYTGGAKAIAHTQKIQFSIILVAMAIAGVMVVLLLPKQIGFTDALYLAGKSGKLNVITTNFDLKDKYNLWSGILGGFFLALSYFGTDQSQVGRYLTAKDLRESRLGLLMNGMVKIPMQFLILLIGALLFSFYTINKAPLFFNESAEKKVARIAPEAYQPLYIEHELTTARNQDIALQLVTLRHQKNPADSSAERLLLGKLKAGQHTVEQQRSEMTQLIKTHKTAVAEPDNDSNYIFLHFVRNYLPAGMIGLLFAIIFLASWGSISAAINSLASSTLVDFHQVFAREPLSDRMQLRYGRYYTLLWGIFSIAVAMFATKMGSLIEAVNELGSLFYGAILGIFLTAFFLKKVKGKAVFYAAIVSEVLVLMIYIFKWVAFLWLNVIGALLVIVIAWLIQYFSDRARRAVIPG